MHLCLVKHPHPPAPLPQAGEGRKPNTFKYLSDPALNPQPSPKRVLIVSGEASGDHHAAQLVREAHKIDPTIYFLAMGGEQMRQAGVDIIVDSKPLAVVGIIEILTHFYPIFRAWKTLRQFIKRQPPDLIVLIDYPEFNLQIAKAAKKAGIKVLYYISPQVWAWKQGRIKTIRERVNKMLVIFPFEEEFYRRGGVPVEFVGHPLTGKVHADRDKTQMRQELQLSSERRVIGLLPGSRKGEIMRLLPVLLAAATQLKHRYPDLDFVLPLASSLSQADLEPHLRNTNLPIKVIPGQFYNTLQLCDAAIVTSGTATLETALMGVPMVIVYKIAASTYHFAKRLIKIPFIGLCNIVAGRPIVKELIQQEANPENIYAEISHILDDDGYRETMRNELLQVKERLGQGGGSEQAAKALLGLLGS